MSTHPSPNPLVWSDPADWETCARDGGIGIGDDGAARLAESHLIAHEPGAFSTQHGEELFQHVQAQVCFDLGQALPQWADCYFYAREEPGNRWPLVVTVNGRAECVGPDTPLAGEFAWYRVRLPREALLPGPNTIVFACESPAAQAWILAVDTSVPNAHSRKSTDGGRTWHASGFGLEGALSGEYVARVRVWEHPARGVLTSPVVSLEPAGQYARTSSTAATAPRLHWRAETPPGTAVALRCRSGEAPALEGSPWIDVTAASVAPNDRMDTRESGNDGISYAGALSDLGPYVQWQAVLRTDDGGATPTLRGVGLSASAAGGAEKIHARALSGTERGIAPSYFFTRQDPAEPKLAILREQERLDVVIAGAETQWAQMLALRAWVAVQWTHRAPHEFRRCCPWDALTILAWMRADRGHGQPQPDAYCTHYAVVLAQCALALGWAARLWVMSAEPTLHTNGHFVAEIWSDAHGKWVMLDADTDSHVERGGAPLGVLEIHDAWRDAALASLEVVAGANAGRVKIGPDWIEEMLPLGLYRFCGLVLRNNHLSTLIPGPVEHGWTTYKWDGFLWWRDGAEPELPFFSLSSNRRADFDWEPEGSGRSPA